MKVSVIRSSSDEEDEIIFRCHTLSDDMDRLIHRLRYGEIKFTGYDEHGISTIVASDIYYFETVDNKVFAYCKQSVYEVKERLYQLVHRFVNNYTNRAGCGFECADKKTQA